MDQDAFAGNVQENAKMQEKVNMNLLHMITTEMDMVRIVLATIVLVGDKNDTRILMTDMVIVGGNMS